MGVPNNLLYLQ